MRKLMPTEACQEHAKWTELIGTLKGLKILPCIQKQAAFFAHQLDRCEESGCYGKGIGKNWNTKIIILYIFLSPQNVTCNLFWLNKTLIYIFFKKKRLAITSCLNPHCSWISQKGNLSFELSWKIKHLE